MSQIETPNGTIATSLAPITSEGVVALTQELETKKATLATHEQHIGKLKAARAQCERNVRQQKETVATETEKASQDELARLLGAKVKDSSLSISAGRIANLTGMADILNRTLTHIDLESLSTQINVLLAKAAVKAAAADLVEVQAAQRIERHMKSLDTVATEEGEIQIRSERYEQERKAAANMRLEAQAFREQAGKMQQVLKVMRG